MTFPNIYQRKLSSVNDVSMMTDVSIATVYSEVYFDYFLSFFQSFFSFFPFVRTKIILYFYVLVLTKYVSWNKITHFLVTSLSAVRLQARIQDGGVKFKMAGL